MSLNVALAGYGYAGKTFHAPLIAATPGLTLHTVVSSNPDKVLADFPAIRIRPDLAAAVADPEIDLVVVATPNELHARQAHQALEGGKHVVVDKPFTLTVKEAKAVIGHAATANRLLSVFHNRRWDADFLTLQRLIGEGTLGTVRQFTSHYDRFRPIVRDRWRERDEPGAGIWYDLAPHLIDQALMLFGLPEAISADIQKQRVGGRLLPRGADLSGHPRDSAQQLPGGRQPLPLRRPRHQGQPGQARARPPGGPAEGRRHAGRVRLGRGSRRRAADRGGRGRRHPQRAAGP
jgi:predicted dehydrogenase